MFEGPIGKQMMIQQGYVPPTCTLDVAMAGPLIYSEVSKGRSPCDGCNGDRLICGGKPKDPDYDKKCGAQNPVSPEPNSDCRIEYHSGSDSQGRCHFSLHWLADYHPGHPDGEYGTRERGQHFFTDPTTKGFPRPEDATRHKDGTHHSG